MSSTHPPFASIPIRGQSSRRRRLNILVIRELFTQVEQYKSSPSDYHNKLFANYLCICFIPCKQWVESIKIHWDFPLPPIHFQCSTPYILLLAALHFVGESPILCCRSLLLLVGVPCIFSTKCRWMAPCNVIVLTLGTV